MLRPNSVEFFSCSHYIQRKIIKGQLLVHYDSQNRVFKAHVIRNYLKRDSEEDRINAYTDNAHTDNSYTDMAKSLLVFIQTIVKRVKRRAIKCTPCAIHCT